MLPYSYILLKSVHLLLLTIIFQTYWTFYIQYFLSTSVTNMGLLCCQSLIIYTMPILCLYPYIKIAWITILLFLSSIWLEKNQNKIKELEELKENELSKGTKRRGIKDEKEMSFILKKFLNWKIFDLWVLSQILVILNITFYPEENINNKRLNNV